MDTYTLLMDLSAAHNVTALRARVSFGSNNPVITNTNQPIPTVSPIIEQLEQNPLISYPMDGNLRHDDEENADSTCLIVSHSCLMHTG
ncbi:hypothetical protein HAX54_025589 [Datura stramonium]|uniref:Uncharacterized protein n=1 Tax=Datura stramonium TaxID=4076 RepID=A0ABS8V291_DATST|nr:hypothetical protein [Datura stramonium]